MIGSMTRNKKNPLTPMFSLEHTYTHKKWRVRGSLCVEFYLSAQSIVPVRGKNEGTHSVSLSTHTHTHS